MSHPPFAPSFDQLPATLPIFPLTGVLLLPHGQLPLNIFEPRFLSMTRDALGGERMIGMVQPQDGQGDAGEPAVYRTGCAGRLTSFSETEDGRYLITLTGVARFDIARELPRERPYRRVVADWTNYRGDLDQEAWSAPAQSGDGPRLLAALKPFFARQGIDADWTAIDASPGERLITTLAMVCPFAPSEKQALLEAPGGAERRRLLVMLMEMAVHDGVVASDGARH